jgi:hypothetical protein
METPDYKERLMKQISDNKDLLTKDQEFPHWQETIKDGEPAGKKLVQVQQASLLAQLRQSIHSSLGKTEEGRSSAEGHNALNITAFTLYENIDGLIRSHHSYLTGATIKADPERLLTLWYIEFANQCRAGKISDLVLARTKTMLAKWIRDIQNLYDPATMKELIGECPNCDQRYFFDQNEEVLRSALYAHYRADNTPEAQCRCCGAQWYGAKELRDLGYHIGATVDEDLLLEMGVL